MSSTKRYATWLSRDDIIRIEHAMRKTYGDDHRVTRAIHNNLVYIQNRIDHQEKVDAIGKDKAHLALQQQA